MMYEHLFLIKIQTDYGHLFLINYYFISNYLKYFFIISYKFSLLFNF